MKGKVETYWNHKAERARFVCESYIGPDGKRHKGKTIYIGSTVTKTADDRQIYWNSKHGGYCFFDPENEDLFIEVPPELRPKDLPKQKDKRIRKNSAAVDFGGSYFLYALLIGIGYMSVLGAIVYGNIQRIYAMIHFYLLSKDSICQASKWLDANYAQYLYPDANLDSQRCSEALETIGRPENYRAFMKKHIEFVLGLFTGVMRIIFDTTGAANSCALYVTRHNKRFGKESKEFRIVIVVELVTGFPIYFSIVEGNIIDNTITKRVIDELKEYNLNVGYILSDAGCLTNEIMANCVCNGVDFMTRLHCNAKLFKEAFAKYKDSIEDRSNLIKYKDRFIYVKEVKANIAVDPKTGEKKEAYIYICLDTKQAAEKQTALYRSEAIKKMSLDEFDEIFHSLGYFCLISTTQIPIVQVIPTYYARQTIEQVIDYAKNDAKLMPIRKHSIEAVYGHVMISFIATFLIVIIKNRLNTLDREYVLVPEALCDQDDLSNYNTVIINTNANGNGNEQSEIYIKQKPLRLVFKESINSLFAALNGQKANVYETIIRPSYPNKQTKEFYDAFNITCPAAIHRDGENLKEEYDCEPKVMTKALIFSRIPDITDEVINSKGEDYKPTHNAAEKKPGKRGARKGSKHQITIAREEFLESEGIDPKSPEGKSLVKLLKAKEKELKGKSIAPYSARGKAELKKVISNAKDPQNNCGQDKEQKRGKPKGAKSEKTRKIEAFLQEQGIDPATDEGKKLVKKLSSAANKLIKKGIDPFSADGQVALQEIIKSKREPGRPSGSKSDTTRAREALLDSFGIDPNTQLGKKFIRVLREAEGKLVEQGIDPYSPEGISRLKESITTKLNSVANATPERGKRLGSKSQKTIEREELMKDCGFDPNSDNGQKLLKKFAKEEKELVKKGIDPRSEEGKSCLQSFINAEMAAMSNSTEKTGAGRPVGSRSSLTIARESFINELGIEQDSKSWRKAVRLLRDAEKKINSPDGNPYSGEGKKRLYDLINADQFCAAS